MSPQRGERGGGGGGLGGGNPVMCMELNNYEGNLPLAKLLLADDAIAAACAEIIIIIIIKSLFIKKIHIFRYK